MLKSCIKQSSYFIFTETIKYILKTSIAYLFYYFGGVFILKFILRKKNVLYVLNYHNFSKYNNFKICRGSALETGYAKNFEKSNENDKLSKIVGNMSQSDDFAVD